MVSILEWNRKTEDFGDLKYVAANQNLLRN